MFTKFSRNARRTFMAACVMSATVLSSCSDDETTPPDTGLPTVKVSSSANSEVVRNTVTLTVEATDDQEIAQIELKIDGTSVKTATTSPFDFAWDTQKAAEGQHTITAIATDKAGNPQSAELKVTVQNVLLKITVSSDHLRTTPNPQRGFIFLSDKDGKTLVAQEYKNGDVIELRAPGYTGETFSVTEVTNPSLGAYAQLVTSVNVTPGNWVISRLKNEASYTLPSVGKANLNFGNAITDVQYALYTNGDYNGVNKDNPSASMELTSTPGVLYVVPMDGSGYGFYNSIKVGANSINLAQANKPFTEVKLTTPEGYYSTDMQLEGLPTATTKNKDIISLGGAAFDKEFTLQYPGAAFPAYYFSASFEGQEEFAYIDVKKPYDMTPLKSTVNVSLSGNKYSGTVKGEGDFVTYYLSGSDEDDFEWALMSPMDDQSIIIPEVPAIVAAAIPPVVVASSTSGMTVTDLLALSGGYNGMLQFVRTSTDGFHDLYKDYVTESKEYQLDVVPGSFTGGRKAGRGREEHRRFSDTWKK